MKSYLKFAASFILILLVSAFLAPLLYDFLPFKFEKIFNRLVMIGTLIAMVCFVRIRRDTFLHYGLRLTKGWSVLFLKGFLIGFMVLFSVTLLRLALGNAVWSPKAFTVWEWTARVLEAFLAACLIGLIEEFFFRGFVFRSLQEKILKNLIAALMVTNLFYSIIHFIGTRKPFIGPDPVFVDSLKLMTAPFMSLGAWQEYWMGAVGLLIFGVLLTVLVLRTGSLLPAMGLHSGCVFYIKMDGAFIHFKDDNLLFFGTKNIYDGIVGWVFLLALFAVIQLFFQKAQGQSGAP